MSITAAEAPRTPDRAEFIAMMAMLTATVAFAIDAMLPALPEIAGSLSPEAPNAAQLVITSFVLGMGLGTFIVGPLSDAWGRKPVIVGGAVLYIAGAVLAYVAPTLETLLAARVIQGLGAAGPRVVALAVIRDLHAGRGMARILAFVMTVFTIVPAIAPLLATGVIALAGWRAVFGMFILFSLISVGWFSIRQGESHPPAARRPLRPRVLLASAREVLAIRIVVLTIGVQSLVFGMLFTVLSTTQPIFDVTYGQGAVFAWWFAAIAVLAASGSFLNAMLVERLGIRRIVSAILLAQVCFAGSVALWASIAPVPLGVFFLWVTSVFFMAGLTIGNLNALAMEPLGHIAGMAASIIGSASTVLAVAVAVPIGLAFDGTPFPSALGTFAAALVARGLMVAVNREVDRIRT